MPLRGAGVKGSASNLVSRYVTRAKAVGFDVMPLICCGTALGSIQITFNAQTAQSPPLCPTPHADMFPGCSGGRGGSSNGGMGGRGRWGGGGGSRGGEKESTKEIETIKQTG